MVRLAGGRSLEPAVEHVGVHAVLQGQGGNGGARLLARGHKFSFELRGVGAVRAPHGVTRGLRFFEHSVHARLRAHDLAQTPTSLQDGFAVCLRSNSLMKASTIRTVLSSAMKSSRHSGSNVTCCLS